MEEDALSDVPDLDANVAAEDWAEEEGEEELDDVMDEDEEEEDEEEEEDGEGEPVGQRPGGADGDDGPQTKRQKCEGAPPAEPDSVRVPAEEREEKEEEESFLVLLELPELQGRQTSLAGVPLRIIGLDEKKPLLQLGSWVFEGQHDIAVGTRMLFAEHPQGPPDAPASKVALQYDSAVHKTIAFQRVFLQPHAPAPTLS